MDNKYAVTLQGVSKKYCLYQHPMHRLYEALPFGRLYHKDFWALQDLSLEIEKGATYGILGRNGSGKSTLLQVVCGILQPTTGTVSTHGRISLLLELGAGFHPELTGRDNVIFNGSFMGFSKKEITALLPAIEAFADIGEYVDQPVKTYSSGMFVRLAFAAAIMVNPDILVVDEALAVGDARFQGKCFRKFSELREKGTTIIFVSHDVDMVTKLCDRAILLEQGRILSQGDPRKVADDYFRHVIYNTRLGTDLKARSSVQTSGACDRSAPANGVESFLAMDTTDDNCAERKLYNKYEHRLGDGRGRIIDFLVQDGNGCALDKMSWGAEVTIMTKYLAKEDIDSPVIGFEFRDKKGVSIYASNTEIEGARVKPLKAGEQVVFTLAFTSCFSGGDVFFSTGFVDNVVGEFVSLDIRQDLIHLPSSCEYESGGMVKLPISVKIVHS